MNQRKFINLLNLYLDGEIEPTDAVDDDVRTAVGQGMRVVHLCDTADASRLQVRLRDLLGTKNDPETGIGLQAILEQLAIARLEDVERQRRAREQDERKRKQGQQIDGHSGKVSTVAPRGPLPCRSADRPS